MLTKTEADLAAEALLARARVESPAIRRRPEMPQWFVDAPDGLDPARKRRRFAELREQAHKTTGWLAMEALLLPLPLWLTLGHHFRPAWMMVFATLQFLFVAGTRLARPALFERLLRLHVKKNATW
jgi:hypothetical protein